MLADKAASTLKQMEESMCLTNLPHSGLFSISQTREQSHKTWTGFFVNVPICTNGQTMATKFLKFSPVASQRRRDKLQYTGVRETSLFPNNTPPLSDI